MTRLVQARTYDKRYVSYTQTVQTINHFDDFLSIYSL